MKSVFCAKSGSNNLAMFMRSLFALTLISACAINSLHAQTALPADSGHFIINQGNHPVGRSDFAIQPVRQGTISTPDAYSVSTHGTLSLQNTTYSFSGSGSLDKDLGLLQENLNGIVNGSAVTFGVRANGGGFVIDISANGRGYRNSLARSAPTVFFPDFDLAGYEVLLALAARHPGTQVTALIPKQTGILSAAKLAPQADVQATLNGRPLTVHHSSLTVNSVVSELYYSGSGRVFEVDLPSQTFAIVREHFQLQPPPPPPPDAAPNAQQPANPASPPASPQ